MLYEVITPLRNFSRSIIRSLTPQQAAGNALAIAVQEPVPAVILEGECLVNNVTLFNILSL